VAALFFAEGLFLAEGLSFAEGLFLTKDLPFGFLALASLDLDGELAVGDESAVVLAGAAQLCSDAAATDSSAKLTAVIHLLFIHVLPVRPLSFQIVLHRRQWAIDLGIGCLKHFTQGAFSNPRLDFVIHE
jgi:hypothetical protein